MANVVKKHSISSELAQKMVDEAVGGWPRSATTLRAASLRALLLAKGAGVDS